jgi:hypothetical protein
MTAKYTRKRVKEACNLVMRNASRHGKPARIFRIGLLRYQTGDRCFDMPQRVRRTGARPDALNIQQLRAGTNYGPFCALPTCDKVEFPL